MKGYVSSALGVPIHVQNLVVRDYCKRHGLTYELSEVENLSGRDVLDRLLVVKPEGIIAYSLEQFTESMLCKISCQLHFAMEDMISDKDTPMLLKLKALLG